MQILGAFLGGNLVNDQLSKISRMIVCQSLYPEDDSVLKSLPRALWIQFLWWIMIQVFSDCVVPENIHTPTTDDSLICTPPNPQDSSFQGVFDDPPSPQEFPEVLNGDFAYHSLEIQSGFGTLKQRKWILTQSVTKIW